MPPDRISRAREWQFLFSHDGGQTWVAVNERREALTARGAFELYTHNRNLDILAKDWLVCPVGSDSETSKRFTLKSITQTTIVEV